jgi:hypothetical protein
MPIDTGLLVSEFEMNNAAMAVETSAVMARFIGEKALHARFLNTLSMLEHLGSHKIMATQRGKTIDQPTLKHLADETRHAFFFKRHADREGGRTLDYEHDDMVAAPSARRYFHRLEAEIARMFDVDAHPRAVYLTMSMIVEFRAVWGYRLYQAALESAGHTVSLKSLLAEDNARVRELCAIEQRLYRKLLSAFAGSVATLPLSIDNAVTTVAGMVAG